MTRLGALSNVRCLQCAGGVVVPPPGQKRTQPMVSSDGEFEAVLQRCHHATPARAEQFCLSPAAFLCYFVSVSGVFIDFCLKQWNCGWLFLLSWIHLTTRHWFSRVLLWGSPAHPSSRVHLSTSDHHKNLLSTSGPSYCPRFFLSFLWKFKTYLKVGRNQKRTPYDYYPALIFL